MSPVLTGLLILVYLLIVFFGIRALVLDKVLPVHLKILGGIAVVIFSIIPVTIYLLLKYVRSADR